MGSSFGKFAAPSSGSSQLLGKFGKFVAPSTISKQLQDFQTTQAVSHAEQQLQDYFDWGGVPEHKDLQDTLYNPQTTICAGYQADAKIKNEDKRQKAKIVQVLRVALLAGAYKLIHSKYTKLPNIQEVLKGLLVAKLLNMVDTITFEVSKCSEMFKRFEFVLSMSGGNVCGTLLKILDKASYVELRIQDSQANASDVQRHISCVKFVCKVENI